MVPHFDDDELPPPVATSEGDPWADEDLPVARDLDETVESAELFLYPGDQHLFADSSLPGYDEGATTLARQRVLSFLGSV